MRTAAIITVSSPWIHEASGSSYHRLWLDALKSPNSALGGTQDEQTSFQEWFLFDAYQNQLPSEEQLEDLAAVCIVGVECESNAWNLLKEHQWAQDLIEFARVCCERPHIRLFGCGLGGHVIAQVIGATVDSNPKNASPQGEIEELTGFFTGVTPIHATPALIDTIGVRLREIRSNFLSPPPRLHQDSVPVDIGSTLFALESHSEQVSDLPEGAQILASSKKTQVEIWSWKEHILVFQCHPEFTPALLREKVFPLLLKAGLVDEAFLSTLDSEMDTSLDSEVLIAMARQFVEGRLDLFNYLYSPDRTASIITAESPGISDVMPISSLGQLDTLVDTAKRMFSSISEAIKGEFRIPQMEYQLLDKMNRVATEKYNHMADFTAGLSVFVESLRNKEESLSPLAERIEGLEKQLNELEALVQQLDMYSRRLEQRMKRFVS